MSNYDVQGEGPIDAISDARTQKRLMLTYVSERINRLPKRMLLYFLGCSLGYFSLGVWNALLAFGILAMGDLLDCLVLARPVRRLVLVHRQQEAQRLAMLSGGFQGLALIAGTSVYFFAYGEGANILFVIGGLGIGAVNAAIILPYNPQVALLRLSLYAIAPIIMLAIRAVQLHSWQPFFVTDTAGVMLLSCMIYMFFAFTRSSLENIKTTQMLEKQRRELKAFNARVELQQSEMRQLSLVARKANDSVIISDKDRNILWVNEAFTRATGFELEEAKGVKIVDLLTGAEKQLKTTMPIDIAVQKGKPFRGEVQNINRDGKRVWLDVNLFPIFGDNGKLEFYVSIERDITEAKALAQEMADARQSAEKAGRIKAEFLANMSHEIRTPLTGVIGMADLLADTDLNDEQARFTETIRGSSVGLMAIINDILDLSKLDAGRMQLNPVHFSPRDCFQETIDLLNPATKGKRLEVRLNVAADVPEVVQADDGRIRQVITNILGNAIKFTAEGCIRVRVWCEGAEGSQMLCFEVHDTGIGIPVEKQAKIFDHFTQAEATTTRMFGGTGLGLSISRHIIKLMGGQISVDSEPGQGATFRVEVPFKPADDSSEIIEREEVTEIIGGNLAPGMSILIAEDNKTNRFLLANYLKDQPVDLQFAIDGVAAVEKVTDNPPDLVFMDMSMPRMSGIEATREIRQLAIKQPAIVALTAHAFADEMQACFDAGMDDFLTKPIRKKTFLDWLIRFQRENNDRAA